MRRPTETRLRRAFADVLTGVMATTALAGVGCGGTTAGTSSGGSSGGGPTPVFTTLCNGPGHGPNTRTFLAGLHATPELDGAVMRSESAFPRTSSPGQPGGVTGDPNAVADEWTATNGDAVGAMCAKASNPSACLAKVQGYRMLPPDRDACAAAYPSAGYLPATCAASYILYTRGDEIGVARTNEEIKALMGATDTLEEALWAANNAGYGESCSYGGKSPDSQYRTTQDGGWDLVLVNTTCGEELYKLTVHVDYAGKVTVVTKEDLGEKVQCSVAGRRPEGLRRDRLVARGNAVGEHFAAMATLEAASVTAFRRLRRQLAAYGAPAELLGRIRKAARDEIRHARATTALAKKYGVTPSAPRIDSCDEAPSLFAIALENAREGCVRETYGALVAQLQTTRAADADVRATMTAIADEETEHAALSWDIAAWIEAQLGDHERMQLGAERQDAFTILARELSVQVDPRVQHASGVPAAHEAVRMLEELAPVMLAAA